MKKEALKTFAKRLDNAPKVHFMCCDNIKACAIVILHPHFFNPDLWFRRFFSKLDSFVKINRR